MRDGQLGNVSGPSFSAPLVAGGAALYLARQKSAAPNDGRTVLLQSREQTALRRDPDRYNEGMRRPIQPNPVRITRPIAARRCMARVLDRDRGRPRRNSGPPITKLRIGKGGRPIR
ncbi:MULTISPECIES: S8 family serine peptidase [unclassified Arthrobacter]|uniref:S8 family serine peptidase n=1 Tax=Arthrobacter sp. 162MFSha1.1 TaxID=1151119 RepID=UPI0012DFD67C